MATTVPLLSYFVWGWLVGCFFTPVNNFWERRFNPCVLLIKTGSQLCLDKTLEAWSNSPRMPEPSLTTTAAGNVSQINGYHRPGAEALKIKSVLLLMKACTMQLMKAEQHKHLSVCAINHFSHKLAHRKWKQITWSYVDRGRPLCQLVQPVGKTKQVFFFFLWKAAQSETTCTV